MNWVCYIIENRGYTYVGVSNNAVKRLRAHNGEIKGEQNIPQVRVLVGNIFV